MATLAEYRARPDLGIHSAIDDADIQVYLDDADIDVVSQSLGARLTRAQIYYAAHFVELFAQGEAGGGGSAPAGPLVERSVGSVSVKFGEGVGGDSSTTSAAADMNSTKFGREYLRLLSISMMGFRSV